MDFHTNEIKIKHPLVAGFHEPSNDTMARQEPAISNSRPAIDMTLIEADCSL
ncbi:hypothetical protein [Azohydromonas australica]|uniref:hypothetical protein n=1 Tax=Azohydromonas australica TaxID=364039 RepID=UPI0003FD7F10|nr:hypothetical protein [Azohydromonas australica]